MQEDRAAAAHLAAIISSSDDAIVSKDLNGIVLSWNGAAERLFGYAAHEVIGRHISLIIPRERLGEEDFVIGQIRAGISLTHYETVRQRKDGSYVDISLTVSPIHDADGTIVGASKIARDISEQKELRRRADEASRAKDQFLATLSHELRTPLNTILGYLHMLQRGSIPQADHAKTFEVLDRNGRALARLVDDVLDTSRVITGKMRLELRPTRLSPLIDQAVESILPAANSKGLRIETQVGDDIAVNADADRLAQILWNLISNAVKFTPSGGSVRVSGTRSAHGVSIAVEDSGAGIHPEDLPLVFQRFWQANPGQGHGGLGLGLALTRHLVELHGGRVSVKSEGPGRGARFEVELQAAERLQEVRGA